MPRKSVALDATSADTKTRILDAAERLFVEHGFEATSLRSLTSAAGVNLAAVNYHFGSKEELFQAVLTRRLDPMNQERIELLERIERESANRPPSVEKILFAMLIPALRLARDEQRGGKHFLKVLGRAYADPAPFIRQFLSESTLLALAGGAGLHRRAGVRLGRDRRRRTSGLARALRSAHLPGLQTLVGQ